jgi:hypothetical protein
LPERVRSLVLPQVSRRPVVGSGAGPHLRHFHADPALRHRGETVPPQNAPARGGDIRPARRAPRSKPETWTGTLRNLIEQNLLLASSVVLTAGALGWGLMIYNEVHSSGLFGQSVYSAPSDADANVDKTDSMGASIHERTEADFASLAAANNGRETVSNPAAMPALSGGESAANVVANEWSAFEPLRQAAATPPPTRTAAPKPSVHVAITAPAPQAAPTVAAAPVRVASADLTAPVQRAVPQAAPIAPTAPVAAPVPMSRFARLPPTTEPKTTLADFETAPFPYTGMVPGIDRPFLTTSDKDDRGHVNFRGRVLWESKTFSDDHVLLHIPPGFDPKRPAVMVVFFHGHGATLARDVRDRQHLPDQISAAGTNAVLVAPQFAYDAADSSAGKFWEDDGFKRFLDEAAQKLAALYGDPRSTSAFAKMPIVLVSYSGGFGPTLSVLARGGANARIRGIVMLDSLYAGVDQFADWIANNRSGFFISAYTPYTAGHNADLKHLLAGRSVPYSSQLSDHLEGTVAFLPADLPHRDFVTNAWTDNPVADILDRIDDLCPKIEAATVSAHN